MTAVEQELDKLVPLYQSLLAQARADQWEMFETTYRQCQTRVDRLLLDESELSAEVATQLQTLRQLHQEVVILAQQRRKVLGAALNELNRSHKANRLYQQTKQGQD